jgi:hypothetical protein
VPFGYAEGYYQRVVVLTIPMLPLSPHMLTFGLLLLNKSIYLERLNLPEKSLLCVEELEKYLKTNLSLEQEFRKSVIIQMYTLYASVLNKLRMNEHALEYAKKGIQLAKTNKSYYYLFTL